MVMSQNKLNVSITMTLLREIRKATRPKKLVHYAVLLGITWISYRLYAALQGEDGRDRPGAFGPRDLGLGRGVGGQGRGEDFDDVGQRFKNLDNRLKDLHSKERDNKAAAKKSPLEDSFKKIDKDTGEAQPKDRSRLEDSFKKVDKDTGEAQPMDSDPFNKVNKDTGKGQPDDSDSLKNANKDKGKTKLEFIGVRDVDGAWGNGAGDGVGVGKSGLSDHEKQGDARDDSADEIKPRFPEVRHIVRSNDDIHPNEKDSKDPSWKKKLHELSKLQKMADERNFPMKFKAEEGDDRTLSFQDKIDRLAIEKALADKENFRLEPAPVDWELEEELQVRRQKHFANVEKLAEPYNPKDFENAQERKDDHMAFVTAFTPTTRWKATLQFIYSVQYFYPDSPIGIFDLGLSEEQKQKLQTFCKVTVQPTFLKFWPPHLKDINRNMWRPMIWQMGLATFGHIVFVEPDRFLMKNKIKEYMDYSLRRGIAVVGRKLQYSPFVVTHPEMYHFLSVDTRKLQRVKMVEITMIVMHNAEPVRHELMRHLMSCTLEEYCVAPPGATPRCDNTFFPNSKKYANCHRYDLSAVNILLDKWFAFRQEEFLFRDVVTSYFDGRDVSSKLRTCPDQPAQNHRQEI